MIIKSLEQLNSFSKKVADRLEEKDCIFLTGEIGVGKTTFTRFLINYLQKKEGLNITEVLSPTFNLLHEYDFKKYKIMHYDLYRLKNEKEVNNLHIFQENEDAIKQLWKGVYLALIASIIGAFIFQIFIGGFSGQAEKLFEGIVMITASLILGTKVL